MKILIVQDFLRSGGTERQSVLLANAFAAAGHATTLLTFRPGGTLDRTVAPTVDRLVLQPVDLGLDWLAPGLVARAHRLAPDVIVCMGRMANCHGWRLTGIAPVVATMRTGKSLPWLFRRTLQHAAHVVANSAEARDNLVAQSLVRAGRVSVIHNSLVFPPESAIWRNQDLRAHYGAQPGTTVMLCVAMFRREKNQRELIEIVSGLPQDLEWQLWLAGDGPEREACVRLTAEKNLEARIKFLGFHANPSPLYCAADLAVHASWSEALSNFLIEAQAHGVLAVAYEAQGIRECFLPGRSGWVIPRDDRAAFRTTLSRRLTEPDIAHAERSADARNYARRTFDPARQVAAYLELFTHLAQSPSA